MASLHFPSIFACLLLQLVYTSAQTLPGLDVSPGNIDRLIIQLVGGSARNEGRVLIRWFPDSPWTAVCNDPYFSHAVPFQMCRTLGYPFACGHDFAGPRRTDDASLVNVTSERYLVSCSADLNDRTLGGCNLHPTGDPPCTHDNDMWLSCGYAGMPDFELRLVEGTYRDPDRLLQGRCGPEHEWSAICGHGFHRLKQGRVACRELGYSDELAVAGGFLSLRELDPQHRPNYTLFVDVGCIGDEASLSECQHYALRDCSGYATLECFTGVTEYNETSYLCGSKQLCQDECKQGHPINGSRDDIFHYCRCDDVCGLFDDCCYDREGMCSLGTPTLERGGFTTEQFGCVWVPGSQFTHIGYVVIDRCPISWTDERSRDLCERPVDIEDVFGSLPVYDDLEVDFKNIYCAICNGRTLESLRRWDVSAADDEQYQPPDIFYPSLNTTLRSLGWLITPPNGHAVLRECPAHLVDTCSDEFSGTRLEEGCKAYYAPIKVEDSYTRYRNPHCALCNGQGVLPDNSCEDQECLEWCVPDPWGPCAGVCAPYDGFLTIEVLFDFTSSSSISGMSCSAGQIYDPFLERCRVLTCAAGYQIVGDECLAVPPAPTNESDSFVVDCLLEGSGFVITAQQIKTEAHLASVLSVSVLVSSAADVRNLVSALDNSIKTNLNSSMPCNISSLAIFLPFSFNGSGLCNNSTLQGSTVFSEYSGRLLTAVQIKNISRENYSKEEVASSCLKVNDLNCSSLLTLEDTEYSVVSAERIDVIATGESLSESEYVLLPEGIAVICSYIHPEPEGVEPQVRRALSFIGSCVSLIALAATFMTFCLFKELRNLSGIATMNLVLALFIAILLFLLSGYLAESQPACQFGAVVAHFAWLAAFFWMTMLAVKVARTLTSMVPRSGRKTGVSRELVAYACLAWGIPLLIVCICIILQYCDCPTLPVIYADGGICWISDIIVRIVAFVVPMALSLVFNLCLYILTIVSVRRNRRSSRAVRSHSKLDEAKEELSIYGKLSALVGVTWIFGFVSQSVTGIIFFSYIYILLNYLQGVFIFISFCLNKRARSLWREKLNIRSETMTTDKSIDPVKPRRSKETALMTTDTLPEHSEDSKL
ncbi:uncharacterized protein LOC119724706 [Patiria miniata]|uniref:G-protein coupled receptors family 2 profile 2 domain-containing protein n=1 Tax=Patiria miniata TaxID=46514 RepID=A0A913ZL91_PATMI|nr:uncharacterized protein LOC119724706 [Patiria miniata]